MMARFGHYIEKVFDFEKAVENICDSRAQPRIATKAIWSSGHLMFLTRLGSLNAVETELKIPKRLDAIIGPKKPSADTIGRVFSLMDPEPLRDLLSLVNHQLKRNKALTCPCPLRFAAVDGHEFFSSRHRNCSQCNERIIEVNGEKVKEYYHRAVVLHLIGYDIALPLDLEPILPGEGELTAVRRLLERALKKYNRFFDVVCGDALYLNAPFFNWVTQHGKHALAVLKGDQRTLLQDAEGLFQKTPAQVWIEDRKTIRYWDVEGFASAEGMAEPLRVLHTEETQNKQERVAGEWVEKSVTVQWWWATTVPVALLPSTALWKAAHHRWDIENDLFNTLSTHWHLDHCFKHNPRAILNFTLTLFITFVLIQSFYLRNLKSEYRKLFTLIATANQIYLGLAAPRSFLNPVLHTPLPP